MKSKFMAIRLLAFVLLSAGICSAADDGRTQYPWWLANSYIDLGASYIYFPISAANLEPGQTAVSIHAPRLGMRATLLGHNFTSRLSGQITYLRPIQWLKFTDADGMRYGKSTANVGTLTARWTEPLKEPLSFYVEGGLGIVTRSNVMLDGKKVIGDANYATFVTGAGFKWRLNDTWDIYMGGTYLPPNRTHDQPRTIMMAVGAVLNMRPLSAKDVRDNASGPAFPKNHIQVGIATDSFGTGVNRFVSEHHIFWGGNANVGSGTTVRYRRNVFHTKKVFALDMGLSAGFWRSAGAATRFTTFSAYPQFRFMVLRTKPADVYLNYSIAGPTYITKTVINGRDTGKHFTFQDLMGAGLYIGKRKNINFEAGIGHFSNGNIFLRNAGVKIPLTFSAGFTF